MQKIVLLTPFLLFVNYLCVAFISTAERMDSQSVRLVFVNPAGRRRYGILITVHRVPYARETANGFIRPFADSCGI